MCIKNSLIFFLALVVYGCTGENNDNHWELETNQSISDTEFIADKSFPKGNVRRYGLNPNENNPEALKNILILADQGLPITFPKGYYPINIRLKGCQDISLNFEDAVIGGKFEITEAGKQPSQRIKISGTLTVLDKLFIRKSQHISFDEMFLKTDTLRQLWGHKNRGVSIYVGSEDIQFNELHISETGGLNDTFYQHSAASLQVHGWSNNPKSIRIKTLTISDSDRTALYLTGTSHYIGKATIENFGLGSSKSMFGLGDASPGEEKRFAGAWINQCDDCTIDTLTIKNPDKKGRFSMKLGLGTYSEPTFINVLKRSKDVKDMTILDDPLTNILVKSELKL